MEESAGEAVTTAARQKTLAAARSGVTTRMVRRCVEACWIARLRAACALLMAGRYPFARPFAWFLGVCGTVAARFRNDNIDSTCGIKLEIPILYMEQVPHIKSTAPSEVHDDSCPSDFKFDETPSWTLVPLDASNFFDVCSKFENDRNDRLGVSRSNVFPKLRNPKLEALNTKPKTLTPKGATTRHAKV